MTTSTRWLLASASLLMAASAFAQQAERRSYIVQLDELPVAAYTGRVPGYAATRPAAGQKLNIRSAQAQAYIGYLNTRQATVLAGLGSVPVTHRYRVAFPGFAARLTDAEVAKLQATAGVRAVSPDRLRTADTSRTPAFLGLTAPGGLWSQGFKGENVIIGIIDSGISPEHPSFSDKVDANGKPVPAQQAGTVVYAPIGATRTWNGSCDAGPGINPAVDCNNKLIGARSFNNGLKSFGFHLTDTEFDSARDSDGHGSHTGSTAGGNSGVAAQVGGVASGEISGMAPRARIAAYKALWRFKESGDNLSHGFDSDSVDAIDTAVADGVDVINYSISGAQTDYLDAVEVAFLFANAANVFVAASAGNSGPANAVAHMSPWLTTVAASTHDRALLADATLGNGAVYTGASFQTTGAASAPLILASAAGVSDFNSLSALQKAALQRCFAAVDLNDASLLGAAAGPAAALDPIKVAGKIVVCDRGSNNRVNKSLAVAQAGGTGVLMVNTSPNTLNADLHSVPTVHLSNTLRTALRTYAATSGATASISPFYASFSAVAPQMASFSSRGPSLANINILKPDITAPGVDILAALTYVPANAVEQAAIVAGAYPPAQFAFEQGTSMSSPHIAGIAAALRQAHPDWTPAVMQSAIMTSATSVLLANGAPDTARFGYGAGHVNPNGATATTLAYDAWLGDYLAFLCGVGSLNPGGGTCQSFGAIAPWNLNLASLTSEVVGAQQIWRTVTNVGSSTATYTASASVPGFSVTVSPSSLMLAPGEQGSFALSALRTTAPIGDWVFGNLEWRNGSEVVRSPVTLRARSLVTAAEVDDNRARGSSTFTIGTGYTGIMRNNSIGLVPATRTAGTVALKKTNCSATVNVPSGAQWLRVALFNSDTSGLGADDLDMEVRASDGTVVGSSGGTTADELVYLDAPAAGSYTVCVIGYNPVGGQSRYTLSTWVGTPGNAVAGALRVISPLNVTTAGTGTVSMQWSVTAGKRYFSTVQFTDGTAQTGQTRVFIDTVTPIAAPALAPAAVNLRKALDKSSDLAKR